MSGRPPTSKPPSSLVAIVDGRRLEDDGARALWERFSRWMDEHKGDLAGFAASEGFASVRPRVEANRPVLIASTTLPQEPYADASAEADGPRPRAGARRGSRKHGKGHRGGKKAAPRK